MGKILKVVLVGAGTRASVYMNVMKQMPEKYQVIAVAEPIESRRQKIAKMHGIKPVMCFAEWKTLFALGKIADVAVICTMDTQHYEPAVAAIDLGYDVLLEKPVSPDPVECLDIAKRAEEKGVKVVVGHVLRYSPLYSTVKDLLDAGRLGEIVSINHEDCLGNVHQSHSYVRGNWGNLERSSCMILSKACHDLDLLQWLIGKQCKKVQSFGALTYYQEKNAPAGAPERCIDGCPVGETCPYNAVKLYLDDKENGWFRAACTREVGATDEMVEKSLRNTQYGKCVFHCDNDVVDHQTVNLLFEGDVTVTFTMNGFNHGGGLLHIFGTRGELRASTAGDRPIELYDFETKQTEKIPIYTGDGIGAGHGDYGIIFTLYEYLTGTYKGCSISDITTSVRNHMIGFAAEQSRATNTVVDLDEFIRNLG